MPPPPPPFAILALVQNAGGGGAYTWDATISLAIMPSLPVKHDLIVGGGWGQAQDVAECEAERCYQRKADELQR